MLRKKAVGVINEKLIVIDRTGVYKRVEKVVIQVKKVLTRGLYLPVGFTIIEWNKLFLEHKII